MIQLAGSRKPRMGGDMESQHAPRMGLFHVLGDDDHEHEYRSRGPEHED